MGTLYQNQGWDFIITIGAYTVPKGKIAPLIKITKTEDGSNTLNFKLKNITSPIEFIDQILQKDQEVIVQFIRGGEVRRLITCLVDTPKMDLLYKTIELDCSNGRDVLIESTMGTLVQSLGYYSKQVLGQTEDLLDQVTARMSTLPSSLDFDSYNQVQITSWIPKDTPDFTFVGTGVQVMKNPTPTIAWQEKSDIINKVNIKLNYKRTRLYEIQRNFSWTAGYVGNSPDFLTNLYSGPSVGMVRNAIDGTDWKLISGPTFTMQYQIITGIMGFLYQTLPIQLLDDDGDPITDPKGDGLWKNVLAEDKASRVVMAASWSMGKRFSQYINEEYNLTVSAPQSIAQYDEVKVDDFVSYEDSYDASDWEAYQKLSNPPADAVINGVDYYVDFVEQTPGTLRNAIVCAVNRAKTTILRTHRGTQVQFKLGTLQPDLELKHTVRVECNELVAQGKVIAIDHFLDVLNGIAETTVTLALFRAQGSSTDTNISPPPRPTYTPDLTGSNVVLGDHYVTDAEAVVPDEWNGMIGTKVVTYSPIKIDDQTTTGLVSKFRPQFTDQFRVDTPPIGDYLRSMKTLTQAGDYTITIPNNDLEGW